MIPLTFYWNALAYDSDKFRNGGTHNFVSKVGEGNLVTQKVMLICYWKN